MIVLENVLEDVFNYLPAIDTYKPVFSYGDRKELNAFLKQSHKSNTSIYPLVWLLLPYRETHMKNKLEANEISLILAVQTNSSMQNKQRFKETYEKVLFPLYDNVIYCLTRANILNVAHEFNVVKHPNYSDETFGDSHAGALIWDALKVSFGITILDTCLKPIKF